MLKSILSYPGSKQKIADVILEQVPDKVDTWYEPFFGGGSITINYLSSYKSISAKRIVVSDLYEPLINFWRVYIEHNSELYRKTKEVLEHNFPSLLEYNNHTQTVELREQALHEGREYFKQFRQGNEHSTDDIERAANFFLRNKLSFSGTTDSGGVSDLNVLRFNYHRLEPLKDSRLAELLSKVELHCCDYKCLLEQATAKDFIFIDPPYYFEKGIGMYGERANTHKGFNHTELKEALDSTRSKWLLTYNDRVFIRQLYDKYYLTDLKLSYSMCRVQTSGTLNGAELMIRNYSTDKKQQSRTDILSGWL